MKDTIASRLRDADLIERRFIDVQDGEKASHDHTKHRPNEVKGNYGVYAGEGLLFIDVDDYDTTPPDELQALPDTLIVKSPHGGKHLYYQSPDNITALLEEAQGTRNITTSWGEIRVDNQYVVGPGSQLDGCSKDWCDDCKKPEGGNYEIQRDRPIAELSWTDLKDILPEQEDDTENSPVDSVDAIEDIDIEERLETALEKDEKLRDLWNGRYSAQGYNDRSSAESALAAKLGYWFNRDRETVRRLMDRADTKKWSERTDDSYRDSILDAVDVGTETYSPPRKAATDGGGAAAAQSPSDATDTVSPSGPIQAPMVVEANNEDPENTTAKALTNSEKAWGLSRIIKKHPDYHFVLTRDTKELYFFEGGVWEQDGEQRLKEICRNVFKSNYSRRTINEVTQHLTSIPDLVIDREKLGAPPRHIAVENGLLDVGNRELDGLQPTDWCISKINTPYDPDAECPQWKEFIDEMVYDQDIPKLQEYIGYTLLHDSQPWGKALFLVGPSNTGKGTCIDVIERLLGQSNVAHQSLYKLIDTRWGAAQIYGSLANIRNEVTPSGLENIQRFKELTGGGDIITAEYKGSDPFDFRCTQKFIFATNQFPNIENADVAFWNRCLFARFPNSVPEEEQDRELADKLSEELPGILNWALDGLDRLTEQNHFTNERAQEDKQGISNVFGSSVARFIHSCLEVTGNRDDQIHKSGLYDVFTAFIDDRGRGGDVPSKKTFTKELEKNGGISSAQSRKVTDGGNRKRVYTGIRLNDRVLDEIEEADETLRTERGDSDDESGDTQSSLGGS